MDPNTHSDRLAALGAAVEDLAAQDLHGLADATLADGVLQLRRLVDRLEGHWLAELAAVDARGAAGDEDGVQVGSTAGWLRSARPPADSASACGWVPGRLATRSGRPGPCSAAPCPTPPRP
jgi:hypothetical protein